MASFVSYYRFNDLRREGFLTVWEDNDRQGEAKATLEQKKKQQKMLMYGFGASLVAVAAYFVAVFLRKDGSSEKEHQ